MEQATTVISDDAKNLHVQIARNFLDKGEQEFWWEEILRKADWYRVCYKSERFGNQCETPCWTNFFGGRKQYSPYQAIPEWLEPLVTKVSKSLQCPVNAILLRLYFDGQDNITWHTDGRTFLGSRPTIGSLSLGAPAKFQMRRMRDVWPCGSDNGIDTNEPIREWTVRSGDMVVMEKDTQDHWHHRVPTEKFRRPRININFRYIIDSPDSLRGQQTFYKYMVSGDNASPPSFSFHDIVKKRSPLMAMLSNETQKDEHGTLLQLPHAPKETPLPKPRDRPNEKRIAESDTSVDSVHAWICESCTFSNDSLHQLCMVCESPRERIDHTVRDTEDVNRWLGGGLCGKRIPHGDISTKHETLAWDCNACTFRQESSMTKCEMCGTPRVPEPRVSSSGAEDRQNAFQSTKKRAKTRPALVNSGNIVSYFLPKKTE